VSVGAHRRDDFGHAPRASIVFGARRSFMWRHQLVADPRKLAGARASN
jgi:hypothetical protein